MNLMDSLSTIDYIIVMSDTEFGNFTVVFSSVPPLTSIFCATVSTMRDYLTSSVTQVPNTPQEKNNLTKKQISNNEKERLESKISFK